jgi:hypothetical protein
MQTSDLQHRVTAAEDVLRRAIAEAEVALTRAKGRGDNMASYRGGSEVAQLWEAQQTLTVLLEQRQEAARSQFH